MDLKAETETRKDMKRGWSELMLSTFYSNATN